MPRLPREQILYDGCFAHIFSRAISHRYIFRDNDDFAAFKALMIKSRKDAGFKIHHYCLMQTHFHWVVQLDTLDAFSRCLRNIKQAYAFWFHDKYRYAGPVWWGRFGSQLIEDEAYMYACGLYVEMNPVEARLVSQSQDWRHSSSRYYFLGESDELVEDYPRINYDRALAYAVGLDFKRGAFVGSENFISRCGK